MKTETVSVSLPAELAEFARQDMHVSAYASLNEYLRDLVRKRREERIRLDIDFLEQSIQNAPREDPGPEFYARVAELQKENRREKKRGK